MILKILKWVLVGTGALVALLIAFSFLWQRFGYRIASEDSAVMGTSRKPCMFTLAVPSGFWTSDHVTGSDALIRTWGGQPFVYLTGVSSWKPNFPGDWHIVTNTLQCKVEPREVLTGRHGAVIPTFLATQCKPQPDLWVQLQGASLLYALVPSGKEVDVIYMTHRDPGKLLQLEGEFKRIAASHYSPPAGSPCQNKR